MRKQTILLLVLGVLTPIMALAQAKVTARLDSTRIKVGSQCRLVVEVSARQGARILWPTLKDHHLSKEIEVVGQRTEGDNEEGQSTMRKVYTLTAWDEGRQTVPALTVDVDGKKYKTQAIALEVATVQTDSIRPDDSKPPYDIQELPFSQEEWTPIYLWSLLALLLTIVGWYLFSRLRSGKPIISHKQILRQEPPHQKALRRINEIKAARLEGGDDQKEYYTLLTEALRRYMSERFGFNAMEMTSQEIVQRLKADQDPTKIDELRELFATADLVKFARFAADRRDLCYFDITVVDERGDRVPDAKCELNCLVDGGELMGIFSGDPANEDQFTSNVCHAFTGRALCVIRTANPGKVTVTVSGDGLTSDTVTVTAE